MPHAHLSQDYLVLGPLPLLLSLLLLPVLYPATTDVPPVTAALGAPGLVTSSSPSSCIPPPSRRSKAFTRIWPMTGISALRPRRSTSSPRFEAAWGWRTSHPASRRKPVHVHNPAYPSSSPPPSHGVRLAAAAGPRSCGEGQRHRREERVNPGDVRRVGQGAAVEAQQGGEAAGGRGEKDRRCSRPSVQWWGRGTCAMTGWRRWGGGGEGATEVKLREGVGGVVEDDGRDGR
jgi:hypothetical protein